MHRQVFFARVLATLLCLCKAIFVSASLQPGSDCEVAVKKIGCFNDDLLPLRTLPELLMTDRDPLSPRFSGKLVDWTNWNVYISDVVCRCAKKAKKEDYKLFGIQFYGECWSGPNTQQTHARAGKSLMCVGNNLTRGCDAASTSQCVGMDGVNFVYHVQEKNNSNQVGFTKFGCFCKGVQNLISRSKKIFDAVSEINWGKWGQFLNDLGPRCAKIARQNGYSYFSLQDFGQCWSGQGDVTALSPGTEPNCCSGSTLGKPCATDDQTCVGNSGKAYVFKLQ